MVDVKKVIKDLVTIKTCCKNMKNEEKYDDVDREMYADWECMIEDVISLLKEQESVTIKKTKEHGFGVYGGICPKCRNWIQSAHSFCGFCGKPVKWE